jgi:hypothetical protein
MNKKTPESHREQCGGREVYWKICPTCPWMLSMRYCVQAVYAPFCKSNVSIQQILSRCSPLDLLRLARTTKAFRALLMSRSSIAIWRSARQMSSDKQVMGMPECPPYLSEPAYANLAFDPHCHVRITSYA